MKIADTTTRSKAFVDHDLILCRYFTDFYLPYINPIKKRISMIVILTLSILIRSLANWSLMR